MPNTSQLTPTVVSCYGGLVLNRDVFTMRPGEALSLQNFEPDIEGGYKKIAGTAKYNSTIVPQVSASTERLNLVAIFNDLIVVARGGTVYTGTTSGSWTSRATSKGTDNTYDFDKFNFNGTNKIIIATGEAAAFTLDTSYSEDIINATGGGTAPTNPKFVKSFANHMFYAGMSNAISSIQFSGPFTEDDFDTGGGTIVVGDVVTGIKVFRDTLFIFCEDSIYKLVGTTSSDFALAEVAKDVGTISHHSIQELGGDLIFLAKDGFRTIAGTERIGDVELGTVSKQIQARISDIGYDNVTAVTLGSKSQYRYFYPPDDTVETSCKGIIAVLKANPESGTLGFEYSDLKGIKPACCDNDLIDNTETTIYGGYDGYVYNMQSGNVFTYATTTANISGFYRSPDLSLGDPGIRKSMQRVLLNYDANDTIDSTNQTFQLRYNFEDTSTPQPDAYSLREGGGQNFYGSGSYGTAIYAAESGIPLARHSVEGSGFVVALKLNDKSSKTPISLKGYELEYVNGGRR
jgi:hypothetical protein